MDILILIAFGAVLLFLIGGFSLGVGSVLSSALLGLNKWLSGGSASSCMDVHSPPEAAASRGRNHSALLKRQADRERQAKVARQARWAAMSPAEQAEAIRIRKKMLYNSLGYEHPPIPHEIKLAKAEQMYQERLQSGYYD